jgi:peroxiredoxin
VQCRSHAGQLGRLYEEFKRENCDILLILGGTVDEARRYADILHLPFPVLSDPARQIYHLYGLEKIMQLIQRTASLVIDRDGMIRYIKVALNPMTWLQESRELLDFVKTLNSKTSNTD